MNAEGRLAEVRARIEAACILAGRDPAEITLVAVSKGKTAGQISEMLDLGVRDIGENKVQEAVAKVAELSGAATATAPRWHFVGQLQRNKARAVAGFASMVHSVDRQGLVTALDRAAEQRSQALDVLVQIDLDPDHDPTRGGVRPADLRALIETVLSAEYLKLRGVMTVAPPSADPRRSFDTLVGYSRSLQAIQPSATVISAGMSGDLEAAISAGATHVRVGTALFGARKLASEHQT